MCLYHIIAMKKLFNIFAGLFVVMSVALPVSESIAWNFNWDSPISLVNEVQIKANEKKSQRIQRTQYDAVSTKCDEIGVDVWFTISRTLCNLKVLSRNYLQYVMYFWLAAATILIIRNWFKIVTSSDREKQIWTFKKNMLYITVWVVLLIWFYYIIELFVTVVNLVAE